MNKLHSYDQDFYQWALNTAALIRQGKLQEIDTEHVAEEIESMGKSDKRELMSRVALLIAHLLKWQLQPERRSNSWKYTIKTQRLDIADLLLDSPSLKPELTKRWKSIYDKALLLTVKETGLSTRKIPKTCPFSMKQVLEKTFFPH